MRGLQTSEKQGRDILEKQTYQDVVSVVFGTLEASHMGELNNRPQKIYRF